jgi:hypothetical protein
VACCKVEEYPITGFCRKRNPILRRKLKRWVSVCENRKYRFFRWGLTDTLSLAMADYSLPMLQFGIWGSLATGIGNCVFRLNWYHAIQVLYSGMRPCSVDAFQV